MFYCKEYWRVFAVSFVTLISKNSVWLYQLHEKKNYLRKFLTNIFATNLLLSYIIIFKYLYLIKSLWEVVILGNGIKINVIIRNIKLLVYTSVVSVKINAKYKSMSNWKYKI